MSLIFIICFVLAGLLVLLVILRLVDVLSLRTWLAKPSKEGKLINAEGLSLYARITGKGDVPIVIVTSLGSPSFEWWPIQDEMVNHAPVVTFDRAGYGWSQNPTKPRTSGNIAIELKSMLDSSGLKLPYLLVGHSIGALYVRHFACLFPEYIEGCIFIDPMSPHDDRFREELPKNIYESSGVDKSQSIRQMMNFSKLGLLRIMRPVLVKSWLWQFYRDLSPQMRNDIFEHFMRVASNQAVLDEYRLVRSSENTEIIDKLTPKFPRVPVKVIYHTPSRIIEDIERYGHLTHEEALQVEEIWLGLTLEYRNLSPKSEWVEAEDSNHFIHLDESTLVTKEILELWRGINCHCRKDDDNGK